MAVGTIKVVKSSSKNSLMEYKGRAFNRSFITDSNFVAFRILTLAERIKKFDGQDTVKDVLAIKCQHSKALKQGPAVAQSSTSPDSMDCTLLEFEDP
ncbi:hypothetical protein J6590_024837 [Homalodisca vitripennis]|nr:hypothetical protein J6590_024837 [Homalodisca vitripennis]